MQKIRQSIDDVFYRSSSLIYDHPWLALIATAMMTVILSMGFSRLYIDVTPEGMLGENNPERVTYNKFRKIFENDEVVTILVETDDVFDAVFLDKLRDFHQELEEKTPYLDKVDSLINARLTRTIENELSVDAIIDEWPENRQAFKSFERRIRNNPAYRNILYAENKRFTTVRINLIAPINEMDAKKDFSYNLLEADEVDLLVQYLLNVTAEFERRGVKTWLIGTPPTAWSLTKAIENDMGLFPGLALAVIAIVLGFLFRRISGVLIPIALVAMSLTATLGAMGLLGFPIASITQIMPSFLLAVGVGDAVHILTIFYRQYDKGEDKKEALTQAYRHSGSAILMTSLTTAGGLISFYFTDLVPVSDFGLVAPLGVIFALLYTLLMIPALVAILPLKAKIRKSLTRSSPIETVLLAAADICVRHPWKVVLSWALLIGLSSYSASHLEFTYQPSLMLAKDHKVRQGVETTNKEMHWGSYLDIVIDSKTPEGLHEPEILNLLEKMRAIAVDLQVGEIKVANAAVMTDLVKEINRALHEDQQSYYRIPESRSLVSQELLLFDLTGSEDLKRLVDERHQQARLTLLVPDKNVFHISQYKKALEKEFDAIMPEGVDYEITGLTAVVIEAFGKLLSTMVGSYAIAMMVIFPLMLLLIGRFSFALVSMIPNMAPIIVGLGFMTIMGIPLNIFTILIGSITIGIAVDDTIHFMQSYMRCRERGESVRHAIDHTVSITGKALMVTSITLIFGFLCFTLSSMESVQSFGMIVSLTIGIAFLADLTLMPSLLTLLDKNTTSSVALDKSVLDESALA